MIPSATCLALLMASVRAEALRISLYLSILIGSTWRVNSVPFDTNETYASFGGILTPNPCSVTSALGVSLSTSALSHQVCTDLVSG